MQAPPAEQRVPFVGRTEVLDAALAALQGPHRRGVALVGPPGQGKTRVAREIVARLDPAEQVASVVATVTAATIPLGALLPVLPEATGRPDTVTDLVARAIRALTTSPDRPSVILVDDAHALDPASATVVHSIAVSGVAVPLLTIRSGELAPDAVTALWKEGFVERIDLAPLTRTESASVAAGIAGGELSGAAVEALWQVGAGNPMVVTELVRGALETGGLASEHGIWRFRSPLRPSARLAELVGDRLASLSKGGRDVVEHLALGEPLPLPLVCGVAGEAVVSELERGGLVIVGEPESGLEQVRLAHPLYAEVVRGQMGVVRARAVSRSLADASETPAGQSVGTLRAAVWRLDGGGPSDPARLLAAARAAFFGRDDSLAERLGAAAVASGAGIDGVLVQAQALSYMGRHAAAADLLAGAGDHPTTDRQRVTVARCISFARFWGLGEGTAGIAELEAAEALVTDAACRRELAAERSVMQLLAGDVSGAVAAAGPIVAADDGRAMVTAAIALSIGLSLDGRSEDALAVSDRAFEVHVRLGDQEALASPGMHVVARALALQEAGRIGESLEVCALGHAAARESSSSSGVAWFLLLSARAALIQGRPVTARRQFGEAAGLFEDLGEFGPRLWALAGCALAAALSGDSTASGDAISAIDSSPPVAMRVMQPELDRARAWHNVSRGDAAEGLERLHRAVASAEEVGSTALAASALHDLARLGAPADSAPRLRSLAADISGPLGPLRARHADALAAEDAAGLEEVSRSWNDVGADLYAAEAAAVASAIWRSCGDRRRADRNANLSREIARRCEGSATPALSLAGEAALLTPREREVGLLAAADLTAKEIAAKLDLSPRTVENHLQRAYSKLAVRNREGLAEVLAPKSGPR